MTQLCYTFLNNKQKPMLNPFPFLLSLSFIAPLVLRIALGGVLLWFTLNKILDTKKGKIYPSPFLTLYIPVVVSVVTGLLLIVGSWTQYAALLAILYAITAFIYEILNNRQTETIIIYFLIFTIAISIATTGAGILAFDLPL
jgi:uncharacterized membrane protein YphA (DoxX/SURF4 family)